MGVSSSRRNYARGGRRSTYALAVVAFYQAMPERWDGVLYRALRDDAAFRFVAVADAGDDVVREIGTPDVAGGVVLVEPFDVPDGAGDAFLDAWERLRAARAQQRGYLGTRLYRAEPALRRSHALVEPADVRAGDGAAGGRGGGRGDAVRLTPRPVHRRAVA